MVSWLSTWPRSVSICSSASCAAERLFFSSRSTAFSAWTWARLSFSVSSALLRIHQMPPSSSTSSAATAPAMISAAPAVAAARPSGPTRLIRRPVAQPTERQAGGGREVRVDVLDAIDREPDVADREVVARCGRLDREADEVAQLRRDAGQQRSATGQRDLEQPRRAGLPR